VKVGNSKILGWGTFLWLVPVAAGMLIFLIQANTRGRHEFPEVTVDNPRIDLGIVRPNTHVSADFTLTNASNKTVEIKSVQPSCECVTVSMDTKTIQPHSKARISGSMDFTKLDGTAFQKQILVTFSLKGQPIIRQLHLDFRGRVDTKELMYIWPGILDFGDICLGDEVEKTLYISSNAATLASIPSELRVSNAPITLRLATPASKSIRWQTKSIKLKIASTTKNGLRKYCFHA
jgi:hypothetical protein